MSLCPNYCKHGGVCSLKPGHEGDHDSGYCQWPGEESISRDEANRMLETRGPAGTLMALRWEMEVPSEEDDDEAL